MRLVKQKTAPVSLPANTATIHCSKPGAAMSDNASQSSPSNASAFFSYRGRLTRRGYWGGISIAGLLLVGAFFALLHASTPTAMTDTAPLALVFLALLLWIHSLVTVKRLRDAGLPAWHYGLYLLGPIAWLALVGQASGAVALVGFVALFVLPGFYKSKPDPAAEAEAA